MKKNTFKSLLSFALIGACFAGFSQQARQSKSNLQQSSFELTEGNQKHFNETGVVRCASVEYENKLRKENPNRLNDQEFENWLAPKVEEYKQRSAAGKMAITTIPIIFHVFSDCAGTDNVSPALIQAQLDQLNIDYAHLAGSTDPDAADTEVRFAFAQVDPSGNILHEPGINRVSTYGGGPFTDTFVDGTLKPATSWNPNNYMNIWVANLSGGLLGWAQFPDSSGLGGLNPSGGAANTDGVVIGSATVGSIAMPNPAGGNYPAGRTLTHEVGHWLGLRHLWGDGTCTADDFVADTLNCDGQYYAGNGTGGCIAPTQCGNVREIENYMDYSDDSCMNEFTAGQKARIQTVLGVSPRRSTLGASTVDNPVSPVVFFDACNNIPSVVEGSACGFQDITFQIGKSQTSTGAETVTVNRAGTATDNVDYAIQTPSLNFAAGSTAKQDFIIRIFEDGVVEADETIILDLNVATGGNSIAAVLAKQITITITNDDAVTTTSQSVTVFSEDFDPLTNNFDLADQDGDGNNWGISNEAAFGSAIGFTGDFAVSNSWIGTPAPSGTALNPNNYIITNVGIVLPTNLTNLELSFDSGTIEAAPFQSEQYSVYLTASSNAATIEATTALYNETLVLAQGFTTRTINIDALAASAAGTPMFLSFRHHDTFDMNTLIIDNISITGTATTVVQTAVNTGGTEDQLTLNEMGSVYTLDSSSGDAMLDIQNNDSFDYGCVTASVNRAGVSAQAYKSGLATDKVFRIGAANTTNSGNTTISFYFTEAELLGWETAASESRANLYVNRDVASTTVETVATTITAFGATGHKVTATFTGVDGDFFFASQAVLKITENQFGDSFTIHPNPSNGELTLSLGTNENVKISLFDIRGRNVYSELHTNNSDVFKTTLDFSSLASGVYMLDVTSGSKRAVKKIVIQ